MIMILGMTLLRHLRAKLVLLGRVSLTTRGTTVNVWPHQRSWSSLTETMPLIQGTLWPATPPCANCTSRIACLRPSSLGTAGGNVALKISNPSKSIPAYSFSGCTSPMIITYVWHYITMCYIEKIRYRPNVVWLWRCVVQRQEVLNPPLVWIVEQDESLRATWLGSLEAAPGGEKPGSAQTNKAPCC